MAEIATLSHHMADDTTVGSSSYKGSTKKLYNPKTKLVICKITGYWRHVGKLAD